MALIFFNSELDTSELFNSQVSKSAAIIVFEYSLDDPVIYFSTIEYVADWEPMIVFIIVPLFIVDVSIFEFTI